MQIFIKTLKGTTITIYPEPDDTIKRVKVMIYACDNIEPKQQKLIFKNKHLDDDDKTLSDYGITKESTINFLLNLKGD